jgi:hypothetical protein
MMKPNDPRRQPQAIGALRWERGIDRSDGSDAKLGAEVA